mmetsp:Transcript_39623/g.92613  ORF Transcript_39623/g.92613 Transcript_39623/m.92613 type:complete len:232 (+) Transcript_39623:525-1220(+)
MFSRYPKGRKEISLRSRFYPTKLHRIISMPARKLSHCGRALGGAVGQKCNHTKWGVVAKALMQVLMRQLQELGCSLLSWHIRRRESGQWIARPGIEKRLGKCFDLAHGMPTTCAQCAFVDRKRAAALAIHSHADDDATQADFAHSKPCSHLGRVFNTDVSEAHALLAAVFEIHGRRCEPAGDTIDRVLPLLVTLLLLHLPLTLCCQKQKLGRGVVHVEERVHTRIRDARSE